MADRDTVRTWLERLARLAAGRLGPRELTAWVDDIAPMLAHRFDDHAFTFDSLDASAADAKFGLPAYADLVANLRAWVNDHKPEPSDAPRIAGPATPRLSDQDKAFVTVWLKRRAAGQIENIAHELHAIREHFEARFAYLIATDEQCRTIATNRGWMPTNTHQNDWADLTEISLTRKLIAIEQIPRDGIRAACLSLLRKAISIHKPDMLHLVPELIQRRGTDEPPDNRPSSVLPEQLKALGIKPAPQPMTPAEAFRAKYGRDPGQLTPTQITEARAQAKAAREALSG